MAVRPGEQNGLQSIGAFCDSKCCRGSKGIIKRCYDFMFASDEQIIDWLPEYNIWNIKRLYSLYNGEEYGTYIVTFGLPQLPDFMKVGVERFRVDPIRPRIDETIVTEESPTEIKTEENTDEIRGNTKKRKIKKAKRIGMTWEKRRMLIKKSMWRERLKEALKRGPANVRDKPPETKKKL